MNRAKGHAKLTPKRERFVQEYLLDRARLRQRVGLAIAPRRRGQIGYELLSTKPVARAIAKARRERAARLQLRADDVVKGMLALAVSCRYETTRVQAWDIVAKHLGPEVFEALRDRIREGLAASQSVAEILGTPSG